MLSVIRYNFSLLLFLCLGNEEVVGKLERSVGANGVPKVPKKEKDVEEDVSDKSEEEWQSDDEQDKILLYELIKPSVSSL
jgi:hypothetical protein